MSGATQVSCGRTFSMVLASGKVYTVGSTEDGQLGTNELGAVSTSASDIVYATHTTFGT
ncbi:hypothetical protein GLX27_002992 [Malassezia furfur]|uniref:Uncharacterized protein n=1 Tax=Malassezia furfur TaxID=55194 RepID=A0ABY8ERZ7_MALFU|nr:hypothetical protein GLX27_002992 [Malassezia furfur]